MRKSAVTEQRETEAKLYWRNRESWAHKKARLTFPDDKDWKKCAELAFKYEFEYDKAHADEYARVIEWESLKKYCALGGYITEAEPCGDVGEYTLHPADNEAEPVSVAYIIKPVKIEPPKRKD